MRKLLSAFALLIVLAALCWPQDRLRGGARLRGGLRVPTGAEFVRDTFTDTEATTLASHTGEIGATWTKHTSFTDTISIQTNRAGKDGGTGSTVYYASGTPPGLVYTIEGVIVDIGNVSRASGVCGWIDTTSDHCICVRRQDAATWQLIKIISGTGTSVDTEPASFSAGASHTLKLVRTANDNFEWFLDGTSLGSFTISDSQFQAAGKVGLRASNIHSATGYHVDRISAW